jgi:transcriptional regulator with XRE-family HTH domain
MHRIKRLRIAQGWSQKCVASELGVSLGEVRCLEQ